MPLTQGIKILKCAVTGQSLENVVVSVIMFVNSDSLFHCGSKTF